MFLHNCCKQPSILESFGRGFMTALGFNMSMCHSNFFAPIFTYFNTPLLRANPFDYQLPNIFSVSELPTPTLMPIITPTNLPLPATPGLNFGSLNLTNSSIFASNSPSLAPVGDYYSPINKVSKVPKKSKSSSSKKTSSKKASKSTASSMGYDVKYQNMSKQDAMLAAKTDSRLENISSGGKGWSISGSSFRNDIPYAKKGTSEILDLVCKKAGVKLIITSALGTSTSPHVHGYHSHYNPENPKLDICPGDGTSMGALASKLDKLTINGIKVFEAGRVRNETDHLDVRISDQAYANLDKLLA